MSESNHNLAKGIVVAGATTLVAVGAVMLGRGWKQDDLNRGLLHTPHWATDQAPAVALVGDVVPGAAVSSLDLMTSQPPESEMTVAEESPITLPPM